MFPFKNSVIPTYLQEANKLLVEGFCIDLSLQIPKDDKRKLSMKNYYKI